MQGLLNHYTSTSIQVWAVFQKLENESNEQFESRIIKESKEYMPNSKMPKNNNYIDIYNTNNKKIKSIKI